MKTTRKVRKTGTILTKITRLTDPCSNLNHRVAMRVEIGGFIEVPYRIPNRKRFVPHETPSPKTTVKQLLAYTKPGKYFT